MEALLFDLDGVLYQGNRIIDGAVETLQWCERRDIPHLFLTNTSSKPRRALVERLSAMGLSVSAEQIFAPGLDLAEQLLGRGELAARLAELALVARDLIVVRRELALKRSRRRRCVSGATRWPTPGAMR